MTFDLEREVQERAKDFCNCGACSVPNCRECKNQHKDDCDINSAAAALRQMHLDTVKACQEIAMHESPPTMIGHKDDDPFASQVKGFDLARTLIAAAIGKVGN